MVKTIALDVKEGCEASTAPKGNTVGNIGITKMLTLWIIVKAG